MKDIIGLESFFGFVASIALAVILWRYDPKESVPSTILVILICTSIIAIWLSVLLYLSKLKAKIEMENLIAQKEEELRKAKEIKEVKLRVIQVYEINGENDSELILILQPNKLLFRDVFITVFKKNKNYEEYIATGKVINVQENELVQVSILSFREPISDDDIPLLVLRIGITDKYFEDRDRLLGMEMTDG